MAEIQLRRLRYFVAVAQELHFGRAARRLDITQPPLSQQIQRLEAELGLSLFRRYPRRVELTSAGKLLLDHAEGLLAQAGRVESAMHAAADGLAGPLSIGFARSSGYVLLPTVLRAFHERYPRVQLVLQEMNSVQQIGALTAGRIDVGIVRQQLPHPEIALEPLANERIVAALPATHPLSGAPAVTLACLRDELFVFLARSVGADYHDCLLNACQAAGFCPRIGQEVSDPSSLISLVSAGLFVGLVPNSLAAAPRPHVTYRLLDDLKITAEFGLASRADNHDVIVERFREVALEVAAHAMTWAGAQLMEATAVGS